MSAPSVVATPATRKLAQDLLELAREHGGAQAVIERLGDCRRGQEAALVAVILNLVAKATDEKVEVLQPGDHPTPTPCLIPEEQERLVRWVIASAARMFQTTPDAVLNGDGRALAKLQATKARHVVQYVLRQHGISFPRIAALTNRRDHTTIMWAVDNVKNDPEKIKAASAILVAACYGKEQQSA